MFINLACSCSGMSANDIKSSSASICERTFLKLALNFSYWIFIILRDENFEHDILSIKLFTASPSPITAICIGKIFNDDKATR